MKIRHIPVLINPLRPSDTYICISKLTFIGSDNGFLSSQRQNIIWTNAEILLIWPFKRNIREILNELINFHWKFNWKCLQNSILSWSK